MRGYGEGGFGVGTLEGGTVEDGESEDGIGPMTSNDLRDIVPRFGAGRNE